MQRLHAEEVSHLVMVQGVDILVDRVPSQLNLTQAKVNAGSLTDVHDLPVGGQYEDEAVQRLEKVRAQLLHHLVPADAWLHTPALAQSLVMRGLDVRILCTLVLIYI